MQPHGNFLGRRHHAQQILTGHLGDVGIGPTPAHQLLEQRRIPIHAFEREFVEAARSLGASDRRIMFVDILPNVLAPVIVYSTLLIPVVIVVEATLTFLGLGLPPPTADWGGMISDGQAYYTTSWWFLIFPGAALLITTLAFNLFGDGVRDAFDPRSDQLIK